MRFGFVAGGSSAQLRHDIRKKDCKSLLKKMEVELWAARRKTKLTLLHCSIAGSPLSGRKNIRTLRQTPWPKRGDWQRRR